MTKYLGWISLLIGLGGSALVSYLEYADKLGGASGSDEATLISVLHAVFWIAGLVTLGFRKFQMLATKIFGMITYAVVVTIAMTAIDIAINGFRIRVM
ncbi:MAG TPA: hypothetical protein VGL53_14095 [Bryobacteraceae bacterium]|jgi:hypothetical protein